MTTGERIKAVRIAKGYNQRQLAKLLHTSPSSLCQYETDARPIPDDKLALASKVLKIPTYEFINGGLEIDKLLKSRNNPVLDYAAKFQPVCGLNPYAAACAMEIAYMSPKSTPENKDLPRFIQPLPRFTNNKDRHELRFLATVSGLQQKTDATLTDIIDISLELHNIKNLERRRTYTTMAKFYAAYTEINIAINQSDEDVVNALDKLTHAKGEIWTS